MSSFHVISCESLIDIREVSSGVAGILDPLTCQGFAKTLTQLGLAWLGPTNKYPSLVLRMVLNNEILNLFHTFLFSFHIGFFFKKKL